MTLLQAHCNALRNHAGSQHRSSHINLTFNLDTGIMLIKNRDLTEGHRQVHELNELNDHQWNGMPWNMAGIWCHHLRDVSITPTHCFIPFSWYCYICICIYFYSYLGSRRAEKNVICSKKNCDGKSSTICKIEYHINIEYSPNNIHISSYICDGSNGF